MGLEKVLRRAKNFWNEFQAEFFVEIGDYGRALDRILAINPGKKRREFLRRILLGLAYEKKRNIDPNFVIEITDDLYRYNQFESIVGNFDYKAVIYRNTDTKQFEKGLDELILDTVSPNNTLLLYYRSMKIFGIGK